MVVVLILLALWIAVLVPGLWKRRADRRPSGSIESFHHQLHLLERAGPKTVPPAYRLETAHAGTGLAPGQSGYPAVSSMPGRPNLVLLRPVDAEDEADGDDRDKVVDPATGARYRRAPMPAQPVGTTDAGAGGAVPGAAGVGPAVAGPAWSAVQTTGQVLGTAPLGVVPPVAPLTRDQARRRRQEILFGLAGTVVVTALGGVVPKLHALWIGTGLAAALLAGFLVLVALAQRWAAEARATRPLPLAGPPSSLQHWPPARPGAWEQDDEVTGLPERRRVAAGR